MRDCKTCKHLIYPTMIGYACKKRGLWGSDIPLFFDGFECKKWKLTNRNDDVNGFVTVEQLKERKSYDNKYSIAREVAEKL